MAAELPRPGVEVVQIIRTVTPTIITPTLVPCVVGVAKQLVDIVVPAAGGGSTINSEALISLPAFFLATAAPGSPPAYTTLDTQKLVLTINNGVEVSVTFAGTSLSPVSVVAQINAAFLTAGVTAALAEVVGTSQFRIRTIGVGEFQTIRIVGGVGKTASVVATAFGLVVEYVYFGTVTYAQKKLRIPTSSFPDPRGNMLQLAIENAATRAFLGLGAGNLLELLRTTSFLRLGGTRSAAVITGSVDLTTLTYGGGGTVDTDTLTLAIDGGANVIITFAAPANAAAIASQINAALGATVATVDISNFLVLTSPTTGILSKVQVVSGTGGSVTDLGLTVTSVVGIGAIAAVDDGNGDTLTPLLQFNTEDFSLVATTAQTIGSTDVTAGGLYGAGTLTTKTLTLSINGEPPQTITFDAATNVVNQAALLAALGAFYPGLVATVGGPGSNKLVLTTTATGAEAEVHIVGGTSLAVLGLTAGTLATGRAFPPLAGDALYIDGVFYANIIQVMPGGVVTQLKIDRQVSISLEVGQKFYIIAKNLAGAVTATRPSADLTLDSNGNVLIKQSILRDTIGARITGTAAAYLSYRAVRKDVSSVATNPSLLKFNSTTELTDELSPVTTDNPLALGLYFALLNAPGVSVTGLGVDEIAADAPYGTVAAYVRAAEYLEAFEVYGVAPLTHDESVAQIFLSHVNLMSGPTEKGERICLFNLAKPTAKVDKLVASGTNGNGVAGNQATQFDTGIVNLAALVLAQGITPTGTIPVSAGLFLDIGSDAKKYSITSISGSIVTVKTTGFTSTENPDAFYSTTALNISPLPTTLLNEPFAVRVRGASLTNTDGTPDRQGISETYAQIAQGYLNRRFWSVAPDKCAATLSGIEQVLEGFYLCAAIAGMIGQQPPQQSFTNFPMTGFTRVIGSTDFFSERQLNIIAAGGNYVVIQEASGQPLISRHALTSDMTSIETRTDIVTKVVDFTAKFLRRGLKNFIGRFNITQGFLDSLGHVIQGMLGFLTDTGILIGAQMNNIIQDESAPDTVLVDIVLDVPFPCNYLKLTLVV
jgi:hypothetical protein